MIEQKRSRKNLKIGIGIFILIVGISYIPLNTTDYVYEITVLQEHIVTSLAWIIVGILIILGTGKIKQLMGKKK